MCKKANEFIRKQVLLLLACKSVSKRSCTFITVIKQVRTFSLNLITSIKNFQTTKYSLERSLQKEWGYNFFFNFSEKNCILTLIGIEINHF